MLGGRYGKRIRKVFSNKKDAESYEYVTLADYKRGTFLPNDDKKIRYKDLFKEYKERVIDQHMKGAIVEGYRLRAFNQMFDDRFIHTLQLADWERYVTNRLNNSIAKTTLNRELNSIKAMFKWAVNVKYLKTNPFKEAKKFKEENVRVRWLDNKEIEKILSDCTAIGDLGLRDIIEFALNTGFRKGNLERVTAHDVVNQRVQAIRTKSGKSYDVPITNQLAALLNRLMLKTSGPLLDFSNFRRRFDLVVKDPTITLHTMRHTFAAQCLKAGVPIDRVCKWLGHHSVEFTRTHYGHLCVNQEAIEINLLNLGHPKTIQSSIEV